MTNSSRYSPTKGKKTDYQICAFDLETTNLNADFGVVLCAAVQMTGMSKPQLLTQRHVSPTWDTGAGNDKQLVRAILAYLNQADFWVAHNGANFDVPFLYSRASYWNLRVPPKRAIMDPVLLARRHFKLSSNRLATIGEYFRLPPKIPVAPTDWVRAALDRNATAMRRIERHCVRDVEILAALAPHLRHYWKNLAGTGAFL